jgi:hypothetical protein
MSVVIRPSSGEDRSFKNAAIEKLSLPSKWAPRSLPAKVAAGGTASVLGVASVGVGVAALAGTAAMTAATAGAAVPALALGAGVLGSTVARSDNADKAIKNHCADVMLRHPEGRSGWSAQERLNCENPYEQRVHEYIAQQEAKTKFGGLYTRASVRQKHENLRKEQDYMRLAYEKYCEAMGGAAQPYELFCRNNRKWFGLGEEVPSHVREFYFKDQQKIDQSHYLATKQEVQARDAFKAQKEVPTSAWDN